MNRKSNAMKVARTRILIILFLTGLLPLAACTYSNIQDEEERQIPVSDFRNIYVQGGFLIRLEQGSETGVKARGLKETLRTLDVRTDSIAGTLTIKRDKFSMSSPELVIRFRELNSLRIEGGATVDTEGYLNVGVLQVRVEGGAKVNLKLKADEVKLRGEGGVVFNLEGVSRKMESDLFGVSYLKARELVTDTAKINIEGVGVASICVNQYLKARMQGLGKLNYTGNPVVDQNIEGLTKITRD